jgi:hypothetical protein
LQAWPPPQTAPQVPQLALSVMVLRHWPLHGVPAAQSQLPLRQTRPDAASRARRFVRRVAPIGAAAAPCQRRELPCRPGSTTAVATNYGRQALIDNYDPVLVSADRLQAKIIRIRLASRSEVGRVELDLLHGRP